MGIYIYNIVGSKCHSSHWSEFSLKEQFTQELFTKFQISGLPACWITLDYPGWSCMELSDFSFLLLQVLQLFCRMLQDMLYIEAPEMLCGWRNFTWLSIMRVTREHFHFWWMLNKVGIFQLPRGCFFWTSAEQMFFLLSSPHWMSFVRGLMGNVV